MKLDYRRLPYIERERELHSVLGLLCWLVDCDRPEEMGYCICMYVCMYTAASKERLLNDQRDADPNGKEKATNGGREEESHTVSE